MNTSKILQGQVTRYEKERHFGFIETADKQTYFFFRDKEEITRQKKAGVITAIHRFSVGDEVEFQVRASGKDNGRLEAFELKFIRNEQWDKLFDEAEKGLPLTGYLKSIKEKLFVKHISTYLLIPVEVSAWETNMDEVYTNRLDSMVNFRLSQPKKVGKLAAILEGREFSTMYNELLALKDSAEKIEGLITGKNADGYFVTVFGDIQGFIIPPKNISKEEESLFFKYNKGDSVMVSVKSIHKNKKISLVF